MSGDPRAERKDEHVRLAAAQRADVAGRPSDFDDARLVHHALGAIDVDAVDLATRVDAFAWPEPLYINGMTGGTERTLRVNRNLAIAAREAGAAMGSGSCSIALDDPAAAPSFRVIREENPDGFVMANLGIGRPADDAKRAVELLRADALQIHLNAVQELVMPEGDRAFSGWLASLEALVAASPVPVIVKEVGFGLSRPTLERLSETGVRIADVAGSGGTDFARIENARRAAGEYAFLAGFGQSTLASLLDAPHDFPAVLASGGVRHPLDVVRALALGADAVGVAGAFLEPALEDAPDAAVEAVSRWVRQTRELAALLGAASVGELRQADVLIGGGLAETCRLLGIDPASFARRSAALA